MVIKYLFVVLMLLFSFKIYAQHTETVKSNLLNGSKGRHLIVGFAVGMKYHTKKNDYEKSLKENETSSCIALNVGINPFKNIEHSIGFEFLAYKYGKSKDKFIENVIGLNIYYKRSFYSSNNIFIFPQATITVVSNDPSLMLSTSIDFGIGYSIDEIEISLKNSYRLNLFTLQKVPSILLLGLSLKI